MKRIKDLFIKIACLAMLVSVLISCATDATQEAVLPAGADASFSYTVDDENPNTIHFEANPAVDTWFTHWSFGDGTSAEGIAVTKTFFVKGDYSVRFKMYTNGGNINSTQTIAIERDAIDDSNFIGNGTFDDDAGWSVINLFEETNLGGEVSFADGVARFTESSGAWKQMGIYTEVVLIAGTYQFDMDMTFTEINDIWGEVYLGKSKPLAGADYNGDLQVLKAYNAWDCTPKTYTGKAVAYGCDPKASPGKFTVSADGTYYLLFRTGGGKYGVDGIVIDNMELRVE
jgi:hypothetical protein